MFVYIDIDEAKVLSLSSPSYMTVKEGGLLDVNCTSNAGYPHPNVTVTLDTTIGSTLPVRINSLLVKFILYV